MTTERAGWLLLLTLLLSGCGTCSGAHLRTGVEKGDVAAIHEMGELGDPIIPPPRTIELLRLDQAIELLRPHLTSSDRFRRLQTVEALRRIGARNSGLVRDRYPDLFDGVLADPDAEIRWRVAWTLGRLGFDRPGLIPLVADPQPRVAERAAWALEQSRCQKAIPALLAAVNRPAPVGPRAIEALQTITGLQHPDAASWQAWGKQRERRQ